MSESQAEGKEIEVNTQRADIEILLKEAQKERKSLSLLVEYLTKNEEKISTDLKLLEGAGPKIIEINEQITNLKDELRKSTLLKEEILKIASTTKEIQVELEQRKSDLDSVNRLVEHVNTKIKGLALQRVIVERANDEAGKLNVLFWDMESRVKRLSEENKVFRKADKNIVRLENMLDRIANRMKVIDDFDNLVKHANLESTRLKGSIQDMGLKIESISSFRNSVISMAEEAKKSKNAFNSMQAGIEELLRQRIVVKSVQEEISHLLEGTNSLRVEMKDINAQSENIAKVTQKLSQFEEQSADVENRLFKIIELQKSTSEVEKRLKNLNLQSSESIEKATLVEGHLSDILNLKSEVEQFLSRKDEISLKLTEFKKETAIADEVENKLHTIREQSLIANQKIDELAGRQEILSQIERKISDLNSTVLNLDIKMENQLERRALVEKLEKKLDSLDYVLEDSNLKIEKVNRFIEFTEQVDLKIEGFKESAKKIEDQLLDSVKTRDEIKQSEKKFKDISANIDNSISNADLKLDKLNAAQEKLATVNALNDELEPTITKLEEKMVFAKELLHKNEKLESTFERIEVRLSDFQERLDNLKAYDERLVDVEKKLAYLDSLEAKVDQKTVELKKREDEVKLAGKEIAGLEALMYEISKERATIEKDKEIFSDLSGQIGIANESVKEIDKQFVRINSKLDNVTTIEQRLNDLEILSDDVSAKISSLKDEEKIIEKSGGHIVELKFLLAEIEKKLGDYIIAKKG